MGEDSIGVMMQTRLDNNEDTKDLTGQVNLALRKRYCRPEWAIFFEVHGETNHIADCIAINMFPSRGHKILGFEIKASRNDWLKELKNGRKADFFVGQCDEWYIVEAYPGIVNKSELPKGWGLISLRNTRLFTKVHSKIRHRKPLSRHFYTKMLEKCYYENVDESTLREAEQRSFDRGREDALKEDFQIKELLNKAKIVDKLKEDGLRIWTHSKAEIKRINDAVELIGMFKRRNYGAIPYVLNSIKKEQESLVRAIGKCEELLGMICIVDEGKEKE